MKRILSNLGVATIASLLAASAAQATVTAALVQNIATTSSPVIGSGQNGVTFGQATGQPNFDLSLGVGTGVSSGATFVGASNLVGGDIVFKNGLIAVGTASTATIGVAVTFTNTHSFSYRPVLQSTLLAAGMGLGVSTFHIQDGLFDSQTCAMTQLKNCGAPDPAGGWLAALYPQGLKSAGSASAGFTFDVSVNGASVYNLTGQMANSGSGIVESFNGADQVLKNFTRVRDDLYGTAYTWDDTQVDIQLPDMLDPGQSVTAIYTITTAAAGPFGGVSYTQGGRTTGLNVLAYSSFGDPTGGKAPIGPSAESSPIFALSSGLTPMDGGAAAGGINLGGFGTFSLPIEMVDEATHTVTAVMNGVTTFAANDPYPYGGGPDPEPAPVPEPAMLGLFALGAAALGLKRRRR